MLNEAAAAFLNRRCKFRPPVANCISTDPDQLAITHRHRLSYLAFIGVPRYLDFRKIPLQRSNGVFKANRY